MRATDLALAGVFVFFEIVNQRAYAEEVYFDPGLLSPVNGSETLADTALLGKVRISGEILLG